MSGRAKEAMKNVPKVDSQKNALFVSHKINIILGGETKNVQNNAFHITLISVSKALTVAQLGLLFAIFSLFS